MLFRIASGQMLGAGHPGRLQLLEIPDAVQAAEGTAMELDDCAFPLLAGIDIHDDPKAAFDGVQRRASWSAPGRAAKGMERSDLLEANGGIFKPQGEAINAGAADDVKVLVVGNPANTNCLIAMSNAPDVPARAVHGDDAPRPQPGDRAARQQARRRPSPRSRNMTVWGNHSPTQYPDLVNAKVGGEDAVGRGRRRGLDRRRVHPHGRQARRRDHRGPRRVERRLGRQRRDRPRPRLGARHTGAATGSRWGSPADGSYGIAEGLICGHPCTLRGRRVLDRPGPRDQRLLARAHRRLGRRAQEERDAVEQLGLI